ncbi:hypothetical protein B0H14DRAFT_3882310 [Mycena olivaceomarginata]|nr:hypothetical protein B0H14DRAFT_3882310 [Mycena olivaceomarginata]
MGFYDLMRKQEEKMKAQQENANKFHEALEALKPHVLAPDKKTAFWNAYMKLGDEHDKEFQQKYSTDLDTALIFAGLFSGLSAGFIMQIDPILLNTLTPPTLLVVSEALLYTTLFTTLLAALLAAAGSRGTLEERGRDHQRKLDGLHNWKSETLLQTFPLLLQLALLLFSIAISVYLWAV